jgi:exoribonuclease R
VVVPRRSVRVAADNAAELMSAVRGIESEMQLPQEFPAEVLAEAERASREPRMPDMDRTDLALVTIDPPHSMDLDQALAIERRGTGFRVWYAIADVAAFVAPDGPLDVEAHRRGETLYAPDHRIPLYPSLISEGAASLLPGQLRPALLWSIDLDETGEGTNVRVERAQVRSRGRLDYANAQRAIDGGSPPEVLSLLRDVGRLRMHREAERGGVSLPLPEQEVVAGPGRWSLEYRRVYDVEGWNAQLSILTGMGCAQIMLYGEVGVVRTLPPARHSALSRLRRTAAALGLQWRAEELYQDFVRTLDPNTPAGAAMLHACATLLRGAGYVAFEGGVPDHIEHAALASEYAHTTAPLRRLVDRYAGEIAVALCADREVPDWVTARLRDLPKEMEEAEQRGHQFEGAIVSLVEASVLADRVGEDFDATVTDIEIRKPSSGVVMLRDPAVEARVTDPSEGTLPLGEQVRVRLASADPATRTLHFTLLP